MSWQDRLRDPLWTSPTGTPFEFIYENLAEEYDLRGTAWDFLDADGTYVQRTGNSGRRRPLLFIFSGDDHDQQADAFMDALGEPGISQLQHPLYGLADVVPMGRVARRDDLKTAANQTLITVTMFVTLRVLFPKAQADTADIIRAGVIDFNTANQQEFGGALDLPNEVAKVGFRNRYQAILNQMHSQLQPVAGLQKGLRNDFNAVFQSIEAGLDTLIGDPITLVAQTQALMQLPARSLGNVGVQLGAYNSIAESFTLGDNAVKQPGIDPDPRNEFVTQQLFAQSAITGSVLSSLNASAAGTDNAAVSSGDFATKTQAVMAADLLLTTFDAITQWRDDNYASLQPAGLVDTGEAWQPLLQTVRLTAGYLIQRSFSLRQERQIILDRARTVLDLEAELYGTIDKNLELLIASNDLSGDEILELPVGRIMTYYQ